MTDTPDRKQADPTLVLLGFLDHYRTVITARIGELDGAQLRTSRLPSGWTPIELLKHLVHMERRWLQWGFRAEQVPAPWGDADAAGRWHVAADERVEDLLAALHAVGERTRVIVGGARPGDVAALGGRFATDAEAPTLAWILGHVLQEYARHAGHLDIVCELTARADAG